MRLWLIRLLCRSLTNELTSYHDEEEGRDFHAWIVPDPKAHRPEEP